MKQHKKRIFGILLSFALMLTMMPALGLGQTAYAVNGDTWSEDQIFNDDASFEFGVEDTSNITITIAEGKTVRVENGIYAWGKTLTVEGKGNLIVNGYNSSGGSGGSAFTGSIIVKGGKVTLTGGEGNPDGDNDTGGNGIEGNVEVLGGSFSATGGNGHTVGQAVRPSNTITCENGIVAQESANGSEWSDISDDRSNEQYVRTIQTYPLWVGGTQVTSANMSGTGWSYTPATTGDNAAPAKLTLNNYSYEGTGYNSDAIHSEENLIIETSGTNNVKNTATTEGTRAIGVTGNLTFQGSGTLNATGGRRSIVANTVTIESGTVNTSNGNYGITASSGDEGNITINGGVVNASGSIHGLQATNDVIIKNGTVIAIATNTDNNNVAIYADKNITIEGGNVEATGLVGIQAYEKLMIEDGIIRATGISAGIGGLAVTINNGTIEATATDDSGGSFGIFGGGSEVTINDGQVTASGSTAGIFGLVKNSIAGTGWTDTEGTEGKADISVSSEGQDLSEYKKVQFPTAHTHIFTYTASGDTITATCSAEGCPLPPSTTGGSDHVATLTIAAPEHTTYGDGNDAAAQITDANSIKGGAKVQYQKKTGDTYGEATETAPADAGTYKASITLGTGNNSATASVEYTIAQKPVTVSGITAGNKEYDGNTAATLNVNSAAVSGIADGDAVELSTTEATGAFSNKKAENGKTVTISGLALTGADAANYVLSSKPTTTANITKKAVTVTGITASNKVYDGTISATVNCGSADINGKVENDDLTFTAPTGSFSDKNVDTDKTVSFNGLELTGSDSANYTLSGQPADTTANITAKPVTITGVTAEDKVYDGDLTATVITAKAVIDGKVGSDDLSFVPGTGTFSDKNVGKDKTVSISGFALTGNDSANYTLASQPADTTADITAKEVKVSGIKAENKTYDGTTNATLDCTSASFDGKLDDDVLTVTANGAFEDANSGTGKTVNISGHTLGGDSKGNYALASEGQQTTDQADIAQKAITGAKVTLDKTQLTYNGQEQSVSVTGVETSDGMTLAATDYEVVSGNKGTDKGDYTVIIEGKGNYKDEATADWKIVEKVSPTPTPTPKKPQTVGKTTVRNTVANTAKKNSVVIYDAVAGATGYDIAYKHKNSSKWVIKKVGKTTRATIGGLTVGGMYQIKVRAKKAETAKYKAATGAWSPVINRYFHTTQKIRLASKAKRSFTMSWKTNPQATNYQVMFTTNKNGAGAAKNINTVGKSATSFTKAGLKSGTTYYVQVREIVKIGNVNYVGNISCPVAVKVK